MEVYSGLDYTGASGSISFDGNPPIGFGIRPIVKGAPATLTLNGKSGEIFTDAWN